MGGGGWGGGHAKTKVLSMGGPGTLTAAVAKAGLQLEVVSRFHYMDSVSAAVQPLAAATMPSQRARRPRARP